MDHYFETTQSEELLCAPSSGGRRRCPIDGSDWIYMQFDTKPRNVEAGSEISIYTDPRIGKVMMLDWIAVYGIGGDIEKATILEEVLSSRAYLAAIAKLCGFDAIRIRGQRTMDSSSAKPGKLKDLTWKLR